jgi:hypothetical protein
MSYAERQHRNRQRWLLFAAIAIGIALLLLTLAQAGHTPSTAASFMLLLPILFIGLLPSPCQLACIDYMRLGFAPGEPVRASSFQRPPPCPRA